jgi:hypothetical protein
MPTTDRQGLRVEITEFLDDGQAPFVRCLFRDVHGREWEVAEKLPVVSMDIGLESSGLPAIGHIGCEIVGRRMEGGQEIVTIDTNQPWGIEATDGTTRFEVRAEQLEPI